MLNVRHIVHLVGADSVDTLCGIKIESGNFATSLPQAVTCPSCDHASEQAGTIIDDDGRLLTIAPAKDADGALTDGTGTRSCMMRTMVLLTRDLRARLRRASIEGKGSQSNMVRKGLEGHLTRLGYPKGSGSQEGIE